MCEESKRPSLKQIQEYCIDKLLVRQGNSKLDPEIDLESCQALNNLLRIIFHHLCMWICFDFLERIVEYFQEPLRPIRDDLEKYKGALRPVLEAKLTEIKELRAQNPEECITPQGLIRITVRHRLHASGIKIKELIEARDFLSETLKISDHLVTPICWYDGSVCIILWTLEGKEEELYCEATKSQKVLYDYGFLMITIGSKEPLELMQQIDEV